MHLHAASSKRINSVALATIYKPYKIVDAKFAPLKARATVGNIKLSSQWQWPSRTVQYTCTEGRKLNNKHCARIWFGKYVFVTGCRDKPGNFKTKQ